ncbi:hypothetical protein PV377_49645, partial [Streptomyces ipomoeae]|nr:hypothetical protein [Streptomyces ipomoeae]
MRGLHSKRRLPDTPEPGHSGDQDRRGPPRPRHIRRIKRPQRLLRLHSPPSEPTRPRRRRSHGLRRGSRPGGLLHHNLGADDLPRKNPTPEVDVITAVPAHPTPRRMRLHGRHHSARDLGIAGEQLRHTGTP